MRLISVIRIRSELEAGIHRGIPNRAPGECRPKRLRQHQGGIGYFDCVSDGCSRDAEWDSGRTCSTIWRSNDQRG